METTFAYCERSNNMRMSYFLMMVLTLVLFANCHMAQAQTTPSDALETKDVSRAVDVGNKICPVSGEKIDENLKATYEYEGKIYNFCCAMCVDAFKKDPQTYIKKVEAELQAKDKDQPSQPK